MPLSKTALFLLLLPFTLALDLVLYAFLQTCPGCSNFSQFLAKETAFSFPVIAGLTVVMTQLVKRFSRSQHTTHSS